MEKPLWLRLIQDVNLWDAFTSLDGRHWLRAGAQIGMEAAGVWVGVFVTPADADASHVLAATFDHVSTPPTHFVHIGRGVGPRHPDV